MLLEWWVLETRGEMLRSHRVLRIERREKMMEQKGEVTSVAFER